MKQIIITKGLSGSGKTTWAEQWAKKHPYTHIICKDDIRATLGKCKESKVIAERNALILNSIKAGYTVIVCDTNLNPLHEKTIRELVPDAIFEIKDFTDVPIETCIDRCSKRPEGREFWERVIKDQQSKWLPPKALYQNPEYYLTDLPKCVIFDLDGTLAFMRDRGPFEDEKCGNDAPNWPVIDIASMFCSFTDMTVFCMSGRKEDTGRTPTEKWLKTVGINYDYLLMRTAGDFRRDSIIKRELYEEHINGKYLVWLVVDDRKQVCDELWIAEGLPLLKFGNSNF